MPPLTVFIQWRHLATQAVSQTILFFLMSKGANQTRPCPPVRRHIQPNFFSPNQPNHTNNQLHPTSNITISFNDVAVKRQRHVCMLFPAAYFREGSRDHRCPTIIVAAHTIDLTIVRSHSNCEGPRISSTRHAVQLHVCSLSPHEY